MKYKFVLKIEAFWIIVENGNYYKKFKYDVIHLKIK